ncbi:cobalt-zinc-cadmium efflux system outer membrane protein [Tahibacter aquaticus]|uniref:Cobalt-zinc-cadmium efflux system outer membrane protein n=1 Tax=Tahibacter aquaticus TaxID=520092 RepID=A0A4R6Z0D0_9GAMM|nr:TolC family protein [Tahibacter aquaticus]TDR44952.1 cobalt-zinc-cadmium efflux system outer membrane protein [Tahibacter aquaticus]
MKIPIARLPLVAALALLAGCASVSRREGADQVEQLLQTRLPSAFQWQHDAQGQAAIGARVTELLAQPLTPARAFQLAQLRNPQIAARYAELGIAQADVVEASRIANPTFSVTAMKDGDAHQISRGLSAPLSDLLLLPSRKRFAAGEYERAQLSIAGNLMNLAADTAADWYQAAAANQIALMREAVAKAADASAELAQRFYTAGNINALELKLEQAAASQARIAAARANADALRARLSLNTRLGLSGSDAARWKFDLPLLAPLPQDDELEPLQQLARAQRLDLAAARRESELLADALGLARRWRLLGEVEVGVEQEKETDGSRLHGPTLSLALPLFNQGQAAIARAEAKLELSRADLAQLQWQVDADVQNGVEQVSALRRIADDYRNALLPQREAVVQRQLERHNYMLIGAFELLLARQQEFDAYQAYLETVRDYWLARVELGRAVGTQLPGDAQAQERTFDAQSLLQAPADDPHAGHSMPETKPASDPHAGHSMPETNSANDPHAGHSMPETKPASDPHAGHSMPETKPANDPHAGHSMPAAPAQKAAAGKHDQQHTDADAKDTATDQEQQP